MDDKSKMKATMDDVTDEIIDFDDLESQLEGELEEKLSELQFLESEREQIGNPDALGLTIKNVVWEQFLNQIAVTAGEDFLSENRTILGINNTRENKSNTMRDAKNLVVDVAADIRKIKDSNTKTMNDVKKGLDIILDKNMASGGLDLRDKAHIQTTENFKEGIIASHNTEIDFQKRYDDWQSNFVKDENGNVVMHDTRINERDANGNIIIGSDGKPKKKQVETLVKGYRKPYDKVRNERGLKGNREKGTAMDETISVGTIVRDPQANAFMTQEERIEFDLSEKNLNEMDSRWNSSKGDNPTDEWLDNANSKGQKPREIFDNLDEESEKQLREKYVEAKEEYEEKKTQAEQKAKEAGKKTKKQEAFRIGGKALRAIIMQLLAELVKEIVGKLVKWFKNKKKSFDSLIESIKAAIKSFVSKLKNHMVNATNTLITTIATAIIGPVVGIIKKVWMMLKQGWKSLKDAVTFLKNPANQNMPMSLKVLEIGKIVMAGVSGVGALVLGEVIEKGLMTVPVFAIEIPLLGNLANIIGIFMGAVVAGIIGAIVINLLDNVTAKKRRELSTEGQIDKGNEILKTQRTLRKVTIAKTDAKKKQTVNTIKARHTEAGEIVREAVSEIFDGETKDNKVDFDEIDSVLDGLLNS